MKKLLLTLSALSVTGSSLAVVDSRQVVDSGYGYTGCHAAAAWNDLWADDNQDYYCIKRSDGTYTLMLYTN